MRFRVASRFGAVSQNTIFFLALVPVFVAVVTACGIDDEPYLAPVDLSNVVVTSNTSARITGMSASGEDEYSPNYLLYYKIYISSVSETSTILPEAMSRINSTLNSDYSGIRPYTTSNTSSIQIFTPTVFSNRNFYPMFAGSDETFSASSTNSITLDFSNLSDVSLPSLAWNSGTAQTLYRSSGGGSFVPSPEDDRRFRNFDGLRETQNRDVAQGSSGGSNEHSYCAVYIIKRGVNPNTLTAIYSAPTFITVFRLPDSY
jgi:hypothetical protein